MKTWETFYVIVGAAGSTLIGIQFIVMTLLATIRRPASAETLGAFATPTVVHFAGAVVISAVMSAPWHSLIGAGVVIAIAAVSAFVYALLVIHRAHRQTTYEPTREDWIWYTILPCGIYAVLVLASVLLVAATTFATFAIAFGALALLLLGIHNAWDTVIYLVLGHTQEH